MDQTVTQCDWLVTVRFTKGSRRVFLVIERESLWLVHVGRRRRDHTRYWIVRSIQRGRVNEWFKDGAGLPGSISRTIQLALGVISTTNHRDYLPGLRIHRHECSLQRARLKTLRLDLVERGHLPGQRGVGSALKIHVDRRVNTKMFGGAGTGDHVAELVLNVVGEIWGV